MVYNRSFIRHGLLFLMVLVLGSNAVLYHTAFGHHLIPKESQGVVIGSIIDLSIVAPILFIAWARKWNWKYIISAIAFGLILTRLLIPMKYLAPFEAITWVGFAVEGMLLILEVLLIMSFVIYLPKIVRTVKQSSIPLLYSFPHAVENHVKNIPIIQVICSEMLVFYYAFASWKKKPSNQGNTFTLHENTSMIAFQIMLIHAIIIESIGVHWWLHDISPVLSIVLLVFNLYAVILFIADIQALRLNPVLITDEKLYLSLGLMKRMDIEWTNVQEIIIDTNELEKKISNDTIEFIAKDLERVYPTVILKLNEPVNAFMLMGLKKSYQYVAIRVDDSQRFIGLLQERLSIGRDSE
ncbi:hypothetical protein [Ornithinibacillus scapharcae]|uniref:hypothetical protein n=1 Tax=Ornithinibacillus scapharcae TaxID=1147159 RepID=UPI000225B8F3|nr:hypothetical protein [Ornithinibacillus scapharcae]